MGVGEDILKILRNEKYSKNDPFFFKESPSKIFEAEKRLNEILPDLAKKITTVGHMLKHKGGPFENISRSEGYQILDSLNKLSPNLGNEVKKIASKVKFEGGGTFKDISRSEGDQAINNINKKLK